MIRRLCTVFLLLCTPWVVADELGDAIRQAENAKSEAERLSRSANESRRKAKELYDDTRVRAFSFAADKFGSASFQFERSAKDYNSARYSLSQLKKYGTASHATDAQKYFGWAAEKYNTAVGLLNQGNERFNNGIEEYNKKLTRQRRDDAAKNFTDAYNLEEKIGNTISEISGKAGADDIMGCLTTARDRASSAMVDFNTAKDRAGNPDTYRDKMKWAIRNFNEAIELFNKAVKDGSCN